MLVMYVRVFEKDEDTDLKKQNRYGKFVESKDQKGPRQEKCRWWDGEEKGCMYVCT